MKTDLPIDDAQMRKYKPGISLMSHSGIALGVLVAAVRLSY